MASDNRHDEYTPTTEEIRVAWSWNGAEGSDAEFDRWLVAHDNALLFGEVR